MEYDSQHQQWYDVYKVLVFCEAIIREISDDSLHAQEVCTLLESCQYLAQSQTVIVQRDEVDASLVNSEDTLNPDELDELFRDLLQD